jgi:cytochrome c oxidase subunit 4
MHEEIKRALLTWLALLTLLALTLGSAYLHLGAWNSIVNLVIALIKAVLVAIVFMRLGAAPASIRLCVGVALFALTLLFVLSGSDYATRVIHRAPWQMPQQLQPAMEGH